MNDSYLLFAGELPEYLGGWHDYVGSYSSVDQALNNVPVAASWFHIVHDSPEGTQIRHGGRTWMCVPFENVVEGQRFYVNPSDDRYRTRTSRPLSRCPRFANTLVWVNL